MHNLLGTGKQVFKTWRDQKILSPENLLKIQEFIDSIVVPPGTGRIPNKIAGGGNGLSADQWKAWILIYSPYILFEYLPTRHYKCWMESVNACHLLCSRITTIQDVATADTALITFCRV